MGFLLSRDNCSPFSWLWSLKQTKKNTMPAIIINHIRTCFWPFKIEEMIVVLMHITLVRRDQQKINKTMRTFCYILNISQGLYSLKCQLPAFYQIRDVCSMADALLPYKRNQKKNFLLSFQGKKMGVVYLELLQYFFLYILLPTDKIKREWLLKNNN